MFHSFSIEWVRMISIRGFSLISIIEFLISHSIDFSFGRKRNLVSIKDFVSIRYQKRAIDVRARSTPRDNHRAGTYLSISVNLSIGRGPAVVVVPP